MWRKICHVEKLQIYMHDRYGEIWNFFTCGVVSYFSTWQMWRNLTFLHILSNFKFLHMIDVEISEVSPHLACVWCGEFLYIYVHIMLFCWKAGFVVIYAVLSRNLFCRDLCTFVGRKIEPKISYVEKKWQISGMTASDATWWPILQPIQLCSSWWPIWQTIKLTPTGDQFCNQCKCVPSGGQFCKTMQVAPKWPNLKLM